MPLSFFYRNRFERRASSCLPHDFDKGRSSWKTIACAAKFRARLPSNAEMIAASQSFEHGCLATTLIAYEITLSLLIRQRRRAEMKGRLNGEKQKKKKKNRFRRTFLTFFVALRKRRWCVKHPYFDRAFLWVFFAKHFEGCNPASRKWTWIKERELH